MDGRPIKSYALSCLLGAIVKCDWIYCSRCINRDGSHTAASIHMTSMNIFGLIIRRNWCSKPLMAVNAIWHCIDGGALLFDSHLPNTRRCRKEWQTSLMPVPISISIVENNQMGLWADQYVGTTKRQRANIEFTCGEWKNAKPIFEVMDFLRRWPLNTQQGPLKIPFSCSLAPLLKGIVCTEIQFVRSPNNAPILGFYVYYLWLWELGYFFSLSSTPCTSPKVEYFTVLAYLRMGRTEHGAWENALNGCWRLACWSGMLCSFCGCVQHSDKM